MMVSTRSYLTVGLAAALVTTSAGAHAVAPATSPALTTVASPAVQLAAALAPLLEPVGSAAAGAFVSADVGGFTESPGDWIINAYGVIQPWVAYGVELFAWATEWLPWPIGLLAPQSDIIYDAWQLFAQSVVYSFAFLVDGQIELVLPTLAAGIQTGIANLIEGEIAWILSFFPPLPPIGLAAATLPESGTLESGPLESVSVESGPLESAPVESGPLESAPAGHSTDQANLAEGSDTAPAEAISPQPTPVAVNPETAPQSKRQTYRNTIREVRPAAAASAGHAETTPTHSQETAESRATEHRAGPAQTPSTRKAIRAAGSDDRAGRTTRAATRPS